MKNHRLTTICPALVLALGLLAPAAQAQPTAADRETARTLMEEGRARIAANDLAGALRAFEAAHAIMGAPTSGLEVARTQAALGRLVEARDTALQVTRMPASPGEPAPSRSPNALEDSADPLGDLSALSNPLTAWSGWKPPAGSLTACDHMSRFPHSRRDQISAPPAKQRGGF